MRQIGTPFGVSHSAAHRVIDTLGPLLALAPVRPRPVDQIAIVDGTLIPTRDHRLAAPSKNYRYSTNLQVATDATTRLVIALDDPQPDNRNETKRSSTAPQASTRSWPGDRSWPPCTTSPWLGEHQPGHGQHLHRVTKRP